MHPGGPFWAKKDAGAWSIAKGEYAEGEDALANLDPNRLMNSDAVADAYWQLYNQPRSAWSSEMEIRPFGEKW